MDRSIHLMVIERHTLLLLTKMTGIARQYRLQKRHLQRQLKEWNDIKVNSTTVHSLKRLKIRSDLLIRLQKDQKHKNEKLLKETDEENYDAVDDELFHIGL